MATAEVIGSPAAPPRVKARGPAPRTVLAIASLGAAVAFVDATIVNIAFPDMARSFPETQISTLSWVLNAYNIVFAAFLVAAGRAADLIGRRRLFVLGLEIFTGASLLCAVAPSASALICFRVLQALGAALIVPSSLALVLSAFPPERRSHGVALLSAVAAAAAGLGPSLGGLLVAAADWRLVFLVNLPIGVTAIVLARRLVESRAPGRRRVPDLVGALWFALGTASLVLAVVKGEEWGWTSAETQTSFAVAVALGAVFVIRCGRHRAPLVDPKLIRIPSFRAANAMTLVASAGFYGYTLANVLFLTGVWRYSVLEAGLALTPGPFVAAAVAGPTSRIAERIGHRPVLVAGGLIWGGAIMWLVTQVGTTPAFVSEWLPGIVLLGLGAGTLFPNLSAAAVASAPGEDFATATGLNSVARQVGAALGVALVIAILGTPTTVSAAAAAFDDAWTFGAACMFGAALGCLGVTRLASERAPALRDAARLLLTAEVPEPAHRPHTRRARRAVVADGKPAMPRAESSAVFLARVPLFAGLEPSLREDVGRRARRVRVEAGEWLFREGEPGDAMFVVYTGRLEVVDEESGEVVRQLGRGDALGELALLTEQPRSASVRAARPTDVLSLGREDFTELLATSPALSLALNRVLAGQLWETRAPAPTARPHPATVALIAFDGQVPAAELGHRLAQAVGQLTSVELLDGSEVSESGAYAPLLDRAEAGSELVLLCAAERGDWHTFCLQQADRILVLTAGGPLPPDFQAAPLLGCELVPYDVEPGTGALDSWTEALDPIESHVLRPADLESGLDRIARRLTGHSVGLVLSGGGARGFAHIGVLEELLSAGIVIDRVAGVSMGAVIGGLFAMGLDPDEIDDRCFEEFVQRRPLRDYTIPRYALIRGERFESMLHRTFGTVAIEELPLGYLCACAELRSGRLEILRSGPLWEAVGLSMCLPIVAPPQVRGRALFVDGSLVDNLPVETVADLGEGPIIAVDVKASAEQPRGRAGPRQRPPSIGETVMRVLLLGTANTSEAARRHADLLIKPRAEGVGLFEFHQLDAAREAGREAARDALEVAPAALLA